MAPHWCCRGKLLFSRHLGVKVQRVLVRSETKIGPRGAYLKGLRLGRDHVVVIGVTSFSKISYAPSLATSEHSNYRRAWTTGTDRQRYHLDSKVAPKYTATAPAARTTNSCASACQSGHMLWIVMLKINDSKMTYNP